MIVFLTSNKIFTQFFLFIFLESGAYSGKQKKDI